MRYLCSAGLHLFHSEESADRCCHCRSSKDFAVRRHFKNLSDAMLKEADIRPLPYDMFGGAREVSIQRKQTT